jgi:hypothetical protein
LDPAIPKSIFNIIKDHKGFVGFCGKMLDTKFEQCSFLTDWVMFSQKDLFCHVIDWSTAYKLTKTAEKPENKSILERFLCAENVLEVCMERVNCVPLVYFS